MNSTPRVVLFGSGSPLSVAAFEALGRFERMAVVVPRPSRAGLRTLLGLAPEPPLPAAARAAGCRVLHWDGAPSIAEVERLQPDLVCVATFPRLLPPAALAAARLGALGLHPSLLPRHRGPEPLFWTYVADDREAGVSVHHLDAGEDTGDLVDQAALPLARGRTLPDLYAELSGLGAALLAGAVEALASGAAPRRPQDPARATREGRGEGFALDPTWSAERAWHVLSGLGGLRPLLRDGAGRPLPHGRATGFRLEAHGRPSGSVESRRGGLRLFCPDGVVEVDAAQH